MGLHRDAIVGTVRFCASSLEATRGGSVHRTAGRKFGIAGFVLCALAGIASIEVHGSELLAVSQAVTGNLNGQEEPLRDQGRATLDEVVVTARRAGDESAQDVPMSISVISPGTLAATNTLALQDVLRTVPSVTYEQYAPGFNRVTIRGLVNSELGVGQIQDRSLVGFYLDDIPMTVNGAIPEIRAVDLERIEVLRGPQGTLFGAGSMAGTVRYITAKPDATQRDGSAEVSSGWTDGGDPSWSVQGEVNVPLASEKLALRLGGYYSQEGGWIEDIGRGIENVNEGQSAQFRVAVRALPTDNLTLDASMFYLGMDVDGRYSVYREIDNRTSSLTAEGFDDDLKVFNLTADYDLGGMNLLSSTSYFDREFDILYNLEALIGAFFGTGPEAPSFIHNKVQNFSQEIRLVGSGDKLTWQIGAFYGEDSRFYSQDAFFVGLDDLVGVPSQSTGTPYPDEIFYGWIDSVDEQWAVFSDAFYALTDKLEVSVGLRYFNFRGPATYFQTGIAGADVDLTPLIQSATERADGLNPRFVARYNVSDDFMVYAEAARGFRYGGVNYPVPESFCGADLEADGIESAPLTFGPDDVWSYTIGEKAQFADRRITFNAAVFYVKWNDAQTIHPLNCAFPFIENSGSLESKGLELESTFRPLDHLALGVNLSYTDVSATEPLENIGVEEGDRAPYSPKWIVSAFGDYVVPFAEGDLAVRADYTYRGEAGTEFNPGNSSFRTIPSFNSLNAAVTYHFETWEVGLYGRNITNDELVSRVRAAAYATSIGDEYAMGRPRTFGIRVQKEF